ncbi:MAG: TolC family protein, partial [Bdellovibrionales bacterium]|nr:TolC family protein [Bdellovibrionales bacterium]
MMNIYHRLARPALSVLVLLSACSVSTPHSDPRYTQDKTASGAHHPASVDVVESNALEEAVEGPIAAHPVRTLHDVLERVQALNPWLKSFDRSVDSAQALVVQAGVLPNPQLDVTLEGFGGTADGFDQSEASILVSQPLELGGKLPARVRLAEAQLQVQRNSVRVALA